MRTPHLSTDMTFVGSALLTRVALVATLALGGCAGGANPLEFAGLKEKPAEHQVANASPKTELQKATEYWGKQAEKNPKNPQAAINYARNLKALGAKEQAFAAVAQAYTINPNHKGLASEYGRLALEQEQISLAEKLLAQADDPINPDWKTISARGTVLAKQGKYRDAIPHYERALALSPNQTSVLNNLALAHAMNGHAEQAEPLLRQAAADQSADPKVSQNLALVLGLEGKHEDAKAVMIRNLPADEVADDTNFVRKMVGTQAPTVFETKTSAIATGSVTSTKAPAKAVRQQVVSQPAPAVDASEMVRRLADGYAGTPADAPVQLVPKR